MSTFGNPPPTPQTPPSKDPQTWKIKIHFVWFSVKLAPFICIKLRLTLTGKLHAAAGPSGLSSGSDEKRPEEEGNSLSLSASGAWGLHLTSQRDLGVYLWETSHVPVQSEWPQQQHLCAKLFYSHSAWSRETPLAPITALSLFGYYVCISSRTFGHLSLVPLFERLLKHGQVSWGSQMKRSLQALTHIMDLNIWI